MWDIAVHPWKMESEAMGIQVDGFSLDGGKTGFPPGTDET